MYFSETLFIKRFLAGLKTLGVDKIPYDTEKFNSGAEYMNRYFIQKREELGAASDELSMLFLKNAISGSYNELREGVARQNGDLMSFINPYYIEATIRLPDKGAEKFLHQRDTDIPSEIIMGFSKAFCEGAGITLK